MADGRDAASEGDREVAGGVAPTRTTTVAQRINRCFELMHPVGEKPPSNRQVAARVKELGGTVSYGHLSEVRNGIKEPSVRLLRLLAQVFGTTPGYFVDDEIAARVDAELDVIAVEHRRAGLQELAMRTASLDRDDRAVLGAMVEEYLRERRDQQS